MTKEQLKRLNGALWLALGDIHGAELADYREQAQTSLDNAKERITEQVKILSAAILEMED